MTHFAGIDVVEVKVLAAIKAILKDPVDLDGRWLPEDLLKRWTVDEQVRQHHLRRR